LNEGGPLLVLVGRRRRRRTRTRRDRRRKRKRKRRRRKDDKKIKATGEENISSSLCLKHEVAETVSTFSAGSLDRQNIFHHLFH
jgi:hypothetical protein